MEADLDMAGHDYNNTLTIFFISYALAEPVTNVLLKRMTPRIFFTAIILSWGLIMVRSLLVPISDTYAFSDSDGDRHFVLRFVGMPMVGAHYILKILTELIFLRFLGLAEAGLFPGMAVLICSGSTASLLLFTTVAVQSTNTL